MRPLIETHPRAAPWLAGAMTVALLAIWNWLSEPGGITARSFPGIVGAGIGVFVAMMDLRRQTRR